MYCVPGAWSILDTNILDVNEQFKYFLSNSSEMLSVFSNLCCSLAIDYKNKFYFTQQWFNKYLLSTYKYQALSLQDARDIKVN